MMGCHDVSQGRGCIYRGRIQRRERPGLLCSVLSAPTWAAMLNLGLWLRIPDVSVPRGLAQVGNNLKKDWGVWPREEKALGPRLPSAHLWRLSRAGMQYWGPECRAGTTGGKQRRPTLLQRAEFPDKLLGAAESFPSPKVFKKTLNVVLIWGTPAWVRVALNGPKSLGWPDFGSSTS